MIARRLNRRLIRGPVGRWIRQAALANPAIAGGRWDRVSLAASAVVNDALFNVASGTITVEQNAFFGHGVSLLTGMHDINVVGPDRATSVPRAGRDITIAEGAWVASNATVLGPCRVGRNAVVAAGAMVIEDVPDHTIVAGVPAREIGRVSSANAREEWPAASTNGTVGAGAGR
jgi:acetyltransferase-like isoleucine patch superfamily enzyme